MENHLYEETLKALAIHAAFYSAVVGSLTYISAMLIGNNSKSSVDHRNNSNQELSDKLINNS